MRRRDGAGRRARRASRGRGSAPAGAPAGRGGLSETPGCEGGREPLSFWWRARGLLGAAPAAAVALYRGRNPHIGRRGGPGRSTGVRLRRCAHAGGGGARGGGGGGY